MIDKASTGRWMVSQPYQLAQRIGVLTAQIDDYNDRVLKITATMQEDPVAHTRNPHSMEDQIVNIVALEVQRNTLRAEYASAVKELRTVIDAIYPDDDLHNLILKARHLRFEQWQQIADCVDRTVRRVMQMNDEAVIRIDQYIEENGNG